MHVEVIIVRRKWNTRYSPLSPSPRLKCLVHLMKTQDKQVLELVEKHGKKWAKIAEEMPRRLAKRIRERYVNHLDPRCDIYPTLRTALCSFLR